MKSTLWIKPLTLLGGCSAINRRDHPEQATTIDEIQVRLTPITLEAVRAQQSIEVENKLRLRMVPTIAHKAIKSDPDVAAMIDEVFRHIQSELEKGNSVRAMKLRQRATNIASEAGQTFTDAYGRDKTTLNLPGSPANNGNAAENTAENTAEKVRHYFNSGIISALQSNGSSKALLLVDEAKRFTSKMDRAFE